jgi:1-acyl-sn-glycerol-3-phosphate acyltransferase
VNTTDIVWVAGRLTLVPLVYVTARLRVYGRERIPEAGGVVLAINHFSWIDTAAFGAACPRTIHYIAKIEAHRVLGLGQLIRAFGTIAVRRGESDREAVRGMREVARHGKVLGVFVEGTRQRSGVPGRAQAGAAMVAISEGVPVVPGAVYGSHSWRFGNFHPVSVAWGEPLRFDGLSRSGRGYREASVEIQRAIHGLWDWLGGMHALGRPRVATPPR